MAAVNRYYMARYHQICRWCCVKVANKGKVSTLNGQTRDQYIKYFEAIDDTDIYRPLVICVTCKFFLAKAVGGCLPKKLPSRFPWTTFSATRFNSCSLLKNDSDRGKMCVMCKEATRFGVRKTADQIIRHKNVGRPRNSKTVRFYVTPK